jgi:SAM-dependent methyltransferase
MPYLVQMGNQIVLDVGAGTGNVAPLLPRSSIYIWLDNDSQKLRGFKAKWPFGLGVLGDATRIGLKDKSVGYALCVALTHHLSDNELNFLFRELARVVKEKLILVDPVENKRSKVSNFLWKYDRGSHPRSPKALYSIIEPWFEVEYVEHFAVYHHYVLWVAIPKRHNM